ncbi:MAG: MucB/RseB C-terminal domain-containing protein, partial [Burkholderiales bacterium]|nr:MucB/RseB C-terminal domain-containing protein [Burkholderiales bacterium]
AVALVACGAHAAPGEDALAWLQRAAQAARGTSFAGTFVHTNGDRTSTVRITHAIVGSDEHERIEPLDGPSYEIVRRNDEMFCNFPDAKTVRLDRRVTARFFPAVFSVSPSAVAASYDVKLGSSERVLGYDCRWIRLEPRDAMRHGQSVCSEVSTGLVIRARTFNDRRQPIEHYTFTDLKIGPQAARKDVKSIFEARVKRWISDSQPREETMTMDTGWAVTNAPAGFLKVAELKRSLPGREHPVSQLIYSDGLASLSVFVEPNKAPARSAEASTEEGATTFFVRPMGETLVSVLGEVPLATAQQVARSVARRP